MKEEIRDAHVSHDVHSVGIVVFDGVKLLDVAGPSEVFIEANRMGATYALSLTTVGARSVTSSTGMTMAVDVDLATPGLHFDTLLVAGGDDVPTHEVTSSLADAVWAVAEGSGRVCSICTGAFILAATGWLTGRRATTHWRQIALLQATYPDILVEPDAIYVRDGDTFTSAGVMASTDLALALVEEDHGEEMAREVAKSLVIFMQRPGGQSQFSPSLGGARPRTPPLRAIYDAVAADPGAAHSVSSLAAQIAVSPRHLSRLFQDEVGMTPSKYVDSVRFDRAKSYLETGHSVTATAQLCGYGSPESLRRAFIAHLGVSPRAFQQRVRFNERTGEAGQPDRDSHTG
jgi:transcriptional regulator GlxA family with amidase domain